MSVLLLFLPLIITLSSPITTAYLLFSSTSDTDQIKCYPNDQQISLTCPPQKIIVINTANFSTELASNTFCQEAGSPIPTNNIHKCHQDIRMILNSKCSAQNECTFVTSELMNNESLCSSIEGYFFINYTCISGK